MTMPDHQELPPLPPRYAGPETGHVAIRRDEDLLEWGREIQRQAFEAGKRSAPAVSGEAVAYRTRYRSEPGMIGHYPWSYTERKPRFPNHEKTIEVEPLYAHPTGEVEKDAARYRWLPHVGADEQGNATLEWWCGDRKITMYPMDGMLLKVWGPDCNSDMSEVRLEDADSVRAAFAWLTAAPKQEQP